jgi:hypothetical protein
MSNTSLNRLASDTQEQFQAALGTNFEVASNELFAPSSFRGGFRLVLVGPSCKLVVSYTDLEVEVSCNGRELFGPTSHSGFAGNMFSLEHLAAALPSIVAGVSQQLCGAG